MPDTSASSVAATVPAAAVPAIAVPAIAVPAIAVPAVAVPAAAAAAAVPGVSSLPAGNLPQPSTTPDARRASTTDKSIPYYEKIRKDLREMLQRKKILDRNLAIQEDQIAKFEASYLEDTPNGNIIRGFENYIKGTAARRRNVIGDADRVFSMSSATFLRAAQQEAEALSQSQSASVSTPTATLNFPLVKKKTIKRRKGEDGSESPSEAETPGPKRVRISFSRQPI